MMKLASIIVAACGLASLAPSAYAFPVQSSIRAGEPAITLVGMGCGPRMLPNKWGKCVPAGFERYNYARHAYDRRVEAHEQRRHLYQRGY